MRRCKPTKCRCWCRLPGNARCNHSIELHRCRTDFGRLACVRMLNESANLLSMRFLLSSTPKPVMAVSQSSIRRNPLRRMREIVSIDGKAWRPGMLSVTQAFLPSGTSSVHNRESATGIRSSDCRPSRSLEPVPTVEEYSWASATFQRQKFHRNICAAAPKYPLATLLQSVAATVLHHLFQQAPHRLYPIH